MIPQPPSPNAVSSHATPARAPSSADRAWNGIGLAPAYVIVRSPNPVFRWSMATAYVGLALLGATLVTGPLNILRRRPNPVSTDLRRDLGIWAGVLAVAHFLIGLQVHMKHRYLYWLEEVKGSTALRPRTDHRPVWLRELYRARRSADCAPPARALERLLPQDARFGPLEATAAVELRAVRARAAARRRLPGHREAEDSLCYCSFSPRAHITAIAVTGLSVEARRSPGDCQTCRPSR